VRRQAIQQFQAFSTSTRIAYDLKFRPALQEFLKGGSNQTLFFNEQDSDPSLFGSTHTS